MLNALPSGSIVRFGQGVYRFSGKIVIPKTCILEGAGNSQLGTVLRITDAIQDAIEITSSEQVILRNFVLDSSVLRSGGSAVLVSGNALLHRFENITFDGHQTQIRFNSGRGWSVTGCNFLNTSLIDIDVQTTIIAPDVDGIISGNVFSTSDLSGTQAVKVSKAIGLTITNNRVIGYENGILIDPTINGNSIIINQNTFRGQSSTGIALLRSGGSATMSEIEISNNIIAGAGVYGILVQASTFTAFSGGTITENIITMSTAGAVGIQLNGDDGMFVEGNLINLTGLSSTCIKIMANSNAANIGHHGYIGSVFLTYAGTNVLVAPYFVPVIIDIDPPSIPAVTQVEVITPFAGARVTDIVVIGRPPLSALPAAINYCGAAVHTAGFLSIYLLNSSGVAVDPSIATWAGYLLRTPV